MLRYAIKQEKAYFHDMNSCGHHLNLLYSIYHYHLKLNLHSLFESVSNIKLADIMYPL